MPDLSLVQRQRDVLRRLTSLVAERAGAEAALDERRQHKTAATEKAFRTIAAAADAELAKQQAALGAAHKQEQDRLKGEFDAGLKAAKLRMDRHLGTYNERTTAIGHKASQELEESKWLAETLVESGQSKIAAEFDVARKGVEKRRAELDQLRSGASDLLAAYRFKPLPEPAGLPEAPVPATSREELVGACDAARSEAFDRLTALDKRVRPLPLRAPAMMIEAIVGGVMAGAAAYRLLQPPSVERIGIAAGGAAAGVLIVLIVIRLALRRRVPTAAAGLADSLASATGACDRALRFAEEQRDRHGIELLAKRDEEVEKANRRFAAARREVGKRLNVNGPRLRDRHSKRLADIRHRFEMSSKVAMAEHDRAQAQAQGVRDARVSKAKQERDAAYSELDDLERDERAAVERHWKDGMAAAMAEVGEIREIVHELCPPWSDPAWAGFAGRDEPPAAVPFGEFAIDLAALPGGLSMDPRMAVPAPTAFQVPALLDFYDKGSLLIRADAANAGRSAAVLRDVMLRLMTAFPPGKLRFTIIDPVGLGQNFAGFMHLADYDEALVGGKIWTDPKHIEQRLADLTEHMETVIQKYLRNEYETIQDYNRQAGEVAEPFRFLVIADFPANLTEAAAKRLASIASSGARCGLYTLIAQTIEGGKARPPAWLPLQALEQSSAVLTLRDGRFVWQNDDFSAWPLQVEEVPPDEQLTALLHKVGSISRDVSRVQVPFEYVAPKADQIWSLDAASEVRVPLGRAGAKHLQYFSLGRGTTQHALIAGRTGSGKSTLLHVLITNLSLWYSPDEVEMYLVDFKKGVEFKTYAAHALPHARVIAVESEREFGLSVLRRLDAELTRRGQLFRDAGVQDVAAYRRHLAESGGNGSSKAALPRVLLIVDEFQEFFVEDDKLAQEAALLMDRLVRQGRAFGMHVVLGSQTLGGAYSIARSTIGQMAVRIALQCSEADSYLILAEDNAAARLLSRPGEAIYNDVSGRVEGNSLFQIVWLPDEKRDVALDKAKAVLTQSGRPRPAPPIVFEGNVPANLALNHQLALQLDGATPLAPPRAWLGDAISIKDPTAAFFRRQSGSNLLIVGQQEEAAGATLLSVCLSLASQCRGPSPSIMILDATPADSPQAALLESLAAGIGARFFRPRDAAGAVAELASELERREAADQHDAAPMYLVVSGLQRIRDLRKEDEFSFSSSEDGSKSTAQQFGRLLREGPGFGVHTIAWCDTVTNVERMLDRNSLREFDSRVLFQMSASDSTHLIDAPVASTLGRYRALLHSEETGVVEKFRPYALPDPAWLDAAAAKIQCPASGRGRNV